MNLRMGGWMDEWATVPTVLCWAASSLSDLFAEAPLRWGTSSLSNFFSEQPLTWATSALICLPASSPIASATHFFSSSSRYNAFSTLQLRSRLPGASQHHWCFPARSRANAFCHSRLQTGIAGAPHHVRAALTLGLNRTNLALPRACIFFCDFYMVSSSPLATVSCTFFRPHLPKVLQTPQFLTVFMWNPALPKVWRAFFRPHLRRVLLTLFKCASLPLQSFAFFVDDFPKSAETDTPTSATAEATLRKKHRVSRPRVFSPVNSLVPNCYTSQLLDDGWLPWWCGWHDGENAHHDCP